MPTVEEGSFNLNTGEAETRGTLDLLTCLHKSVRSRFSEIQCLKKEGEEGLSKTPKVQLWCPTHTHKQGSVQPHTHNPHSNKTMFWLISGK